MKRQKMFRKQSKRNFSAGAKVNRKNLQRLPMRGGIRL